MLSNYNQGVIFLGCCFPIKLFKSIFNPFLSAIFVAFSQKSHLNWILVCFYLISVVWLSPCSSLPLDLSKNLMRVSSRTYCGCLRTSLRTFYDFLRTKYILLRTIIASIYECDFREENHMVVGHFKRYFKYTLYIIISMNIVMSSSKDCSFNQNLAYLWSFLSISAFVSINFCNFAVKQQ